MQKKKIKRKIIVSKWKVVVSAVLLLCMGLALIFSKELEHIFGYNQVLSTHMTTREVILTGDYSVEYIDVGQGNATFISLPDGKTVLIDGGDTEYGATVVKYLSQKNIEKIDFMIATHADSDHIGGLNAVLDNFEVVNIYRPFQIAIRPRTEEEKANEPENTDNYTVFEYEDLANLYLQIQEDTNSKSKICKISTTVYRKFIEKVYTETYTDIGGEKQSNITVFYDGLHITGMNYDIEFFGPLKRDEVIDISENSSRTSGFVTKGYGASSSSSNDNSAIFTVECFDDKYLFVGDARFTENNSDSNNFSEYDFINSLTASEKAEINEVDVLLVGHHGSKYSTSSELLNLVMPRFVVISVGLNNYGHPEDEVLERLTNSQGLESDYLLRTDKNGNIIFSNINGELLFFAEKQIIEQELKISFKLMVIVITICLLVFVWAIRVKSKKDTRV